jgi:hypothetical protein
MKISATLAVLALIAPSPIFATILGTQDISVRISHVEGNALDTTCTDAIKRALMTSFNTVHLDSDFSAAYTELYAELTITEDTDAFPVPSRKSTLRGKMDGSWTNVDIGAKIVFGCDKCDYQQDSVLRPGFFLEQVGASPLLVDAIVVHRQFETETRKELHASDCAAFNFLRDVEILYTSGTEKAVAVDSDVLRTPKQAPRPLISKRYTQTMATEITGVDADELNGDCLEVLDKLSTALYNTLLPANGDTDLLIINSLSLEATVHPDGEPKANTYYGDNAWKSSWVLASGHVDFVCWDCLSNKDGDLVTPGAHQLQFMASHRDFEIVLMQELRDATSCDAFDHITDVKVHYGESADAALLLAKTKDSTSSLLTATKRATTVDLDETVEKTLLFSVGLDDIDMNTMNAECVDILNDVIVHEYNALHGDDEIIAVRAIITTEVFVAPGADVVGKANDITALKKLRAVKWNTTYGRMAGRYDFRCHRIFCNPDEDKSYGIDGVVLASLFSIHETLELNVMTKIKASSCTAFAGVTDVEIKFEEPPSVAVTY